MVNDYACYSNAKTWNVAQWLLDKRRTFIHNMAAGFMRTTTEYEQMHPYEQFIQYAGITGLKTEAGVSFYDHELCFAELNIVMYKLAANPFTEYAA